MILKKPYAFIIKHFKLIHLIILGCIIFSVYTLTGISSLFNTLITTRTYTYSGADVYINPVIYVFIILALAMSVVLYILLKKKNKPVGLYLGLVIYNVATFIAYIYLYSMLSDMMYNTVEVDKLRFARDLVYMIYIPSYVFIVLCFIRGVGFNLKQFNFSKDIEELKIADKDSEEFELMVGQNSYKYKRIIRRSIRETKYYILENMFAITVVSVILGIVLVFLGVKYYKKFIAKVKAQQVTQVNGVNYVLNKAYITAEDFNGNLIKEGSKFVVLDMSFENVSSTDATLDFDRLTLLNKELKYKPTLAFNYKFYDLGSPYETDVSIPKGEMLRKYVIFELPESSTTTNFVLRIEYGVYSKKDKVLDNYVQFDVAAKNIDTEDKHEYLHVGDELYTNVNGENEFKLKINSYAIQENYTDKYVICNKKLVCQKYNKLISANQYSKKTMLVIDFDGQIYEDAKFTQTFNDYSKIFIGYGTVEYQSANRIYSEKISLATNEKIEDKMFILVDNKIKDSKKISLHFKFRNTVYTIYLKEN